MHLCNCEVALGGDIRSTVIKRGVTIPEIAVLEAIHGDGSVTNIERAGQVTRGSKDEMQRLKKIYAPTAMGTRGRVVEKLFPGLNPKLPTTLDDIDKVASHVVQDAEEAESEPESEADTDDNNSNPLE